jgi:hypothetical protein
VGICTVPVRSALRRRPLSRDFADGKWTGLVVLMGPCCRGQTSLRYHRLLPTRLAWRLLLLDATAGHDDRQTSGPPRHTCLLALPHTGKSLRLLFSSPLLLAESCGPKLTPVALAFITLPRPRSISRSATGLGLPHVYTRFEFHLRAWMRRQAHEYADPRIHYCVIDVHDIMVKSPPVPVSRSTPGSELCSRSSSLMVHGAIKQLPVLRGVVPAARVR